MSDPPTEPGWYNDPEGRYSHQAYWDGEKWTGATRSPPQGQDDSRTTPMVVAFVIAALFLLLLFMFLRVGFGMLPG